MGRGKLQGGRGLGRGGVKDIHIYEECGATFAISGNDHVRMGMRILLTCGVVGLLILGIPE